MVSSTGGQKFFRTKGGRWTQVDRYVTDLGRVELAAISATLICPFQPIMGLPEAFDMWQKGNGVRLGPECRAHLTN